MQPSQASPSLQTPPAKPLAPLLSPWKEIRQRQERLNKEKSRQERWLVMRPSTDILFFHKAYLIVQLIQEAFLGNLVEAKHCVNAK